MDLCERRQDGSGRRHPWEVARARHVVALLRAAAPRHAALLDVGAGDSYVASTVVAHRPDLGRVVCWDTNYSDEDLVRPPAELAARIERTRTQPSGRFDVVLMLDVIEHVVDDVAFLTQVREQSAHAGTTAVITVPAFPSLFGPHDVALGHHRRYRSASLRHALTAAGWQVDVVGSFFTLPLLARAAQVAVVKASRQPEPPADLGAWQGGSAITATASAVLSADAACSRALVGTGRRWLPGLSLYAVARPGRSDPS